MPHRYKNDPIMEMICVFEFDPASPWDSAIPGILYEELKGRFPSRRQVRQFQTAIQTNGDQIEHTIVPISRLQFVGEDASSLVQVSTHSLSFNHLRPYPGWENVLPIAMDLFKTYRAVAGPLGVRTMGLRYINGVTLPGNPANLEDYFEFYPHMGSKMEQTYGAFVVGVNYGFEDLRDSLRVQMTNGRPPKPNTVSIRLELEYALVKAGSIGFDAVADWLGVAHERIETTFEGCLNDSLRELFDKDDAGA